jgi:phosphoribosylaminoimidazole-succinocarboxamide synthase
VSERYIELYEHIIGEKFVPADTEGNLEERIKRNVTQWLVERK